MEQALVVIKLNVNVASEIRTKASATLLRNVSMPGIHAKLIGMFVDRYKLQDELLGQTKQDWIDSCLTLDDEYYKQQNCCMMHKDWDMFERMAIANNWQDLFIEDEKGGNNEW